LIGHAAPCNNAVTEDRADMARHDQTTASGQDMLQFDQIFDAGQSLLGQAEAFIMTMFRTWNLYQLAIAVGLFVVAHLLRVALGPRIRAWMATRENWPKWRMRILAVIHQRLHAIFSSP
jgi:hypothetical protein